MSAERIATLAALAGLIVRMIKSNVANSLLQKLGLPNIPKPALPWVALAAGVLGSVLSAMAGGATLEASLLACLDGVFAGALAIAGQETLKPGARKVAPRLASILFGKAAE